MTDLDATLGALRSRTRREILSMVWDRQMAAGDIAAAFPVSAATISEHLSVLRGAGLVEMTKAGTSRLYRARPDALSGPHGALSADSKWRPAADVPERRLASTSTGQVVVASVDLPTSVDDAFNAFVDGDNFSRWIGAPVRLEDGQFAATLEWGTEVRGRYELVVPPHLIVMSWDFDDDNMPVPGRPLTTYTYGSRRTEGAAGSWCTSSSTRQPMPASWRALGRGCWAGSRRPNSEPSLARRRPQPSHGEQSRPVRCRQPQRPRCRGTPRSWRPAR
jgi:DNA-binding transcriptional ArsR family regulator